MAKAGRGEGGIDRQLAQLVVNTFRKFFFVATSSDDERMRVSNFEGGEDRETGRPLLRWPKSDINYFPEEVEDFKTTEFEKVTRPHVT